MIDAEASALRTRLLKDSRRSAHITLSSSLFKEKFTSPLSLIFSTVMEDSGSWESNFLIRSHPNISLCGWAIKGVKRIDIKRLCADAIGHN